MKEECRTAREFNGKQEEYAAIQFEFNDGGLGKAEENGLSTEKGARSHGLSSSFP